ncbi:hypothetical protein H0N95_02305 [Candidatus Micrarchaeota archaeon]|nr:hypothetical protein [Candidatus Micrarchaeota archaeon]
MVKNIDDEIKEIQTKMMATKSHLGRIEMERKLEILLERKKKMASWETA